MHLLTTAKGSSVVRAANGRPYILKENKHLLQNVNQSGGLLLAAGWTAATPGIVPTGHNVTESHYPPHKI